jgi:methionyl-tRNA synthetase
MTWPIVPKASSELWRRLGLDGDIDTRDLNKDGSWDLLPAGTRVATGAPLWPRIEDEAI